MNSHMKRYIGLGVPEPKSFCLCGVGVHHAPGTWIYSPTWKFFRLHTIGFLRRLHHVGMIIYKFHSQPLFPPCRMGSGAENSKLLSMAWSPSRSPPRVTSFEQKTLLSSQKCQGIQEFCVRNWGQISNNRTSDSKGFRSPVQEPGSDTNIYVISVISQQNTSKGLLFTEDGKCLSCLHAEFFYDPKVLSDASNEKPNYSGLCKHESIFFFI